MKILFCMLKTKKNLPGTKVRGYLKITKNMNFIYGFSKYIFGNPLLPEMEDHKGETGSP